MTLAKNPTGILFILIMSSVEWKTEGMILSENKSFSECIERLPSKKKKTKQQENSGDENKGKRGTIPKNSAEGGNRPG